MGHDTPPSWDREMRDRLVSGEAAALAELYDRFASLAFGIAQRVLEDEEVAERVMAEVFERLWESPGDYCPDQGPVRSWIAAEAHLRAVDLLRQQAGAQDSGTQPDARPGSEAEADADADADAPPQPAHEPTPLPGAAERLRATATTARADYIFTAMPAPLREALELTRFQHHDYRRTARVLGISEAEACRRLRLGLQLLSSAAAYPMGTTREGP